MTICWTGRLSYSSRNSLYQRISYYVNGSTLFNERLPPQKVFHFSYENTFRRPHSMNSNEFSQYCLRVLWHRLKTTSHVISSVDHTLRSKREGINFQPHQPLEVSRCLCSAKTVLPGPLAALPVVLWTSTRSCLFVNWGPWPTPRLLTTLPELLAPLR